MQSIEILEDIDAKPELGRSYACYARLLKTQGNDAKCKQVATQAVKLFGALIMNADLAEVLPLSDPS